jgi:hypothetical protein
MFDPFGDDKSWEKFKPGKDAKILFCACVIPEKGLIPSIAPPNFDDFVCEDHIALLEKTTKLGGKLTIEFVPICPGEAYPVDSGGPKYCVSSARPRNGARVRHRMRRRRVFRISKDNIDESVCSGAHFERR